MARITLRRVASLLALWVLGVQCPALSAQAEPAGGPALPLEEAVKLALLSHPSAQAAARQVQGAQAVLSGARRPPSPEAYIVPAGKIDDASFVAMQRFELGGKWAARIAAAFSSLSRSQWEREAVRQEIVLRVRTAYANALEAQAIQQLSQEAAKLVRQVAEAAQHSFELGNVPRSHVVRARVEQARADQELTKAEAALAIAQAALNTAIGRRADTPVSLAGTLDFHPSQIALDGQIEQALARRPEIRSAQSATEAAGHELTVARRDLWPDLLLEGRLSRLGGGAERPAGIGLTLPFLDWGRRRAEIRRAEAERASQRALQDQVANEVALQVEEAVRSLKAAAQAVKIYEGGIVAQAEELMQMTQTGYAEGAISYLEVLDARRALTEARQGYSRALADHARSLAALQRATGAPLP